MVLYLYLLLIAAIGAVITAAILKKQSKTRKQLPPKEFESRFDPARNNGESENSDAYAFMRKLMSPDESGDPTGSTGYNDFLAEKITDPAEAKKIILKSPRKYFRAYEHFAQIITDDKDLEELLLHWKDDNFSPNPVYNNKFDEIFKKFLARRMEYIQEQIKFNVYPCETSEEALELNL